MLSFSALNQLNSFTDDTRLEIDSCKSTCKANLIFKLHFYVDWMFQTRLTSMVGTTYLVFKECANSSQIIRQIVSNFIFRLQSRSTILPWKKKVRDPYCNN